MFLFPPAINPTFDNLLIGDVLPDTMTTKQFAIHPETSKHLTVTTVTSKPHGLIEVSFTNIGATITSWKIGKIVKKELVLGFHDPAYYLLPPKENPYFGILLVDTWRI